jgi:hypothetical protein
MAQEIRITCFKDGTVKKETIGFTGGECITKTAFLDKALGLTGEVKKTSEYFQVPEQNKQVEKQW